MKKVVISYKMNYDGIESNRFEKILKIPDVTKSGKRVCKGINCEDCILYTTGCFQTLGHPVEIKVKIKETA